MSRTPVLILAFNRPKQLHELISTLRRTKPSIIYCAQDGPRKSHPSDLQKCAAVTKVWDEIDWKCEKHFLIRKMNLGCQRGVSGAVSWFFSTEELGIILEDDCIPHPTFFRFCEEILHAYRDDERVMHISGNSFQKKHKKGYRFSQYPHCWGWATWKRAWDKFDVQMQDWPNYKELNWLLVRFPSPLSRFFWTKLFDGVHRKQIDSWAIPWVYSIWSQNGLCIQPNMNLVTNIGFGKDSTHTPDSSSPLANISTHSMFFPLQHPKKVIIDQNAEDWDQLFVYEQRTARQLFLRVKNLTSLGIL